MNGIAKDQRRYVSIAVKQIRTASVFDFEIDLQKLLLSEANARSIMKIWNDALTDSDLDKAEKFKDECITWTDKVSQTIDRSWKSLCESLLQSVNKHAGLLRTLNRFNAYEIEYNTIRDILEGKSQTHAYQSTLEEISSVRGFIKRLENEISGLGALPEGLMEFMEGVNSSEGVPFLSYFDPSRSQTEIRTWLELNGFLSQLVLKAKG